MDIKTVSFYPRGEHRCSVGEVDNDASIEDRVIAALRSVYDPELPVNIYDLGLIYSLQIDDDGAVAVRMTLTTPACPVAGSLPRKVEQVVGEVKGVTAARVELVWDPPWTRERISEAAQLELGIL